MDRFKPENPSKVLSGYVMEYKKREDMTYRELADRFGCSVKHAHNVATGLSQVGIDLAARICEAIGIIPHVVFHEAKQNAVINNAMRKASIDARRQA